MTVNFTRFCEQKRVKTGIILCIAGIILNLLLFFLKYTGGTKSSSVAVTADGFNNLADTGSCVLTLTSFLISCKKPNPKYPLGYGRWEYVSGLLISSAVLLIAVKMLFTSFGKLLYPRPIEYDTKVILILLISITVKGVMYFYNRYYGKKLQSTAIRAAAVDSLSDCAATLAILAALLIEKFSGFCADGFTGILAAFCILYAGLISFKESASPLLGKRLDTKTLEKLQSLIQDYPQIKKFEAPLVHDYGPHKKLLTFSVSAEDAPFILPRLKEKIREQLQMDAVISPLIDETGAKENKPHQNCPKYLRTKENQEREINEHQTR